jgi:hypothetical protein
MNDQQRALEIVKQVGSIQFEGTIIPFSWFDHVRTTKNQPYLAAILVLSELVYWYRPIIELDERSGKVRHLRKRFSGAKFRTSYSYFTERYGLSKRQAQDAIDFLVEKKLITKEIRKRVEERGVVYGNVMFLEVQPEAVLQISQVTTTDDADPAPPSTLQGTRSTLQVMRSSPTGDEVVPHRGGASPPQGRPLTEINEINSRSLQRKTPPPQGSSVEPTARAVGEGAEERGGEEVEWEILQRLGLGGSREQQNGPARAERARRQAAASGSRRRR